MPASVNTQISEEPGIAGIGYYKPFGNNFSKISTFKTYLALGDSYTIGEGVDLFDSFPYQLVQLLRKNGQYYAAPEIIAKTGWTSGDLINQLSLSELLPSYDLVTLLAGVNNQYRKLATDIYKREFTILAEKAIQCADNNADRIYILSIPDWGVTPFGISHEQKNISAEIDLYNTINQKIALDYKIKYIDITRESRHLSSDAGCYVKDQLHYSAKVFKQWTELLLIEILHQNH